MKTGKYILLSLILLISCEDETSPHFPILSLTPETLSIENGAVGELTLQIENLDVSIFGISLRIAYDTSSVSFTGSTELVEGFFFGSETVTFVKDTSFYHWFYL